MYEFIPEIMREAAKIMLSAHDIDAAVTVKPGDANFVTAYDVAVQDFLIAGLTKKLPHAVVIGEESDDNHTELLASSLSLIIDPIDGTTNFIHDYHRSAISVGVCDRGTMVYGAIYDPYLDRMFTAEKDCGAFVTSAGVSKPMHVSSRPLAQALTGYGTSPYYRDELGEETFRTAYKLFLATHDVRRAGSAALDLCDIACGSLDVFFEYRLSPWDFAAGSLIISEAGGRITQMDGSPLTWDRPCSVIAGNPVTHRELLDGDFFA
ncbi:MAG: inositol monophosphatase [Clostridia bacterium]|nr:inositol monophosphatase [Clostridia bacterium]